MSDDLSSQLKPMILKGTDNSSDFFVIRRSVWITKKTEVSGTDRFTVQTLHVCVIVHVVFARKAF